MEHEHDLEYGKCRLCPYQEYYNAADPEDYYKEEWEAKRAGCVCTWDWVGGSYGANKRVLEMANCPFHQVMF